MTESIVNCLIEAKDTTLTSRTFATTTTIEKSQVLELSLMEPAPRKIQKSYRRVPTALSITVQKSTI